MKWKMVWIQCSDGKRTLAHHRSELPRYRLILKISGYGGFCTVRTYWLTIERNEKVVLAVRFFKCGDAKDWAERFIDGGAIVTPSMIIPLYS